MGKKRTVIRQTGKHVLSDDTIRTTYGKRHGVRYQYRKLSGRRWVAWACGPFHSRTYGAVGHGISEDNNIARKRAKVALQRNLANNYGYIGHIRYSSTDDADVTGLSPCEVLGRANSAEREVLLNTVVMSR